jgi:hypothetical protein
MIALWVILCIAGGAFLFVAAAVWVFCVITTLAFSWGTVFWIWIAVLLCGGKLVIDGKGEEF